MPRKKKRKTLTGGLQTSNPKRTSIKDAVLGKPNNPHDELVRHGIFIPGDTALELPSMHLFEPSKKEREIAEKHLCQLANPQPVARYEDGPD
ncbi:hypothetical protein D3C81_376520 [compost metagenome]